jgi:hypothetical protein
MSGGDIIRSNCPRCKTRLQSNAQLAGRQTRCPDISCGAVFAIPLRPADDFEATQRRHHGGAGTKESEVRAAVRSDVTPPHGRRRAFWAAGLAAAGLILCLVALIDWRMNGREGKSATKASEASGAIRTEIVAKEAGTKPSQAPTSDPGSTRADQLSVAPASSPPSDRDEKASRANPSIAQADPPPPPPPASDGAPAGAQSAAISAPNENTRAAPSQTAFISDDKAWSVDRVTIKSLETDYDTDLHPAAFGGSYTIRPTSKSRLLLITFELEALAPDPNAVTKLARLRERIQSTINERVSPGNVLKHFMGGVRLSPENQRELGETKNYRIFDMGIAVLVDSTGERFQPVWCVSPLPEMTLLYGMNGAFEHFSRHANEYLPKHWLKTLRANGQQSINSNGTFVGLLETKCPVNVSLLYDVPGSIDQNDLSLSLDLRAPPSEGSREPEKARPRRPRMLAGLDQPAGTIPKRENPRRRSIEQDGGDGAPKRTFVRDADAQKQEAEKDSPDCILYLPRKQHESGIETQPIVKLDPSRFEKTTVQISSDDIRKLAKHSKRRPSGMVESDGKGGVKYFFILGIFMTDAKIVPSLSKELGMKFNLDVPLYLNLVHDVPGKRLYVDAEPARSNMVGPRQ